MSVIRFKNNGIWEEVAVGVPNKREVYVQEDEPTDIPEGSIWIDLGEEGLPNSPENNIPNIYVVDAKTADITQVDFSKYKIGDVVLVTTS